MPASALPRIPGRRTPHSSLPGQVRTAARLTRLLPLLLCCAALPARAWVDTATQALPLADVQKQSAAPDSMPLHVALSLKLQNAYQLQSFLEGTHTAGNPAYGSKMTPQQFTAAYAPSAAQAQLVANYLKSYGFQNVSIAPNRLLVTADGTAALAQAAFNTPIALVQLAAASVYANTKTAQVPDTLGDVVLAVLGLQNAIHPVLPKLQARSTTSLSLGGAGTVQPLDLKDFPIAYDAQSAPTAANTTYAIFMDGDVSGILSDLRQNETANGLPAAPVDIVYTDVKGPVDSGGDPEWDLDSQSSRGIAGAVKTMIWYAPSTLDTDALILTAFNRWVSDDLAINANSSFGDCEVGARYSGEEKADDQVFMEAAAQGQTFFNAIGDSGAGCSIGLLPNGIPDGGLPEQGYPAASPYVVAVGGTTLYTNADFTYAREMAWDATGGGISLTEPQPSWQHGVVGVLSTELNRKACPDMAMDAAADSGANLIVAGAAATYGGTSLASPLATGTWARLESASGNKLGFAAPILYTQEAKAVVEGSYATSITGFHDVTTGFNGLYAAKKGWDYTTGVGTFDICVAAGLLAPASGKNYCAAP